MTSALNTNKHQSTVIEIANHSWQLKYICFIATWIVLIASSLWWNLSQIKESTKATAAATARANINRDLAFRAWVNSHGGVYVPTDEHTPSNIYLQIPDRDITTNSGKKLTLMNPAYALRQLQTDFPSEYSKNHLTSLKTINPNNKPDAWETESLRRFEQGAKERIELQETNGEPYLRMMQPIIMEERCLKCHGDQGYKKGDIRGGISTSVALLPYLPGEREDRWRLALSHSVIWLIGVIGFGIFYHREKRFVWIQQKAQETLNKQNVWLEAEVERRHQENQQVQLQLLQSEKLAAIGQLAAGVAHEINNPIGFVNSNLNTLNAYINDIFELLNRYDRVLDEQAPNLLEAIAKLKAEKELDYLSQDAPELIAESIDGLNRVKDIIQDLKNFSRVDSNEWELTDINKCLDSTLNIIWNELKYHCTVNKQYGDIPEIICMPSQLNQVFLNLLVNAGQAIKGKGEITIQTGCSSSEVWVKISDTGQGIPPEHINRLFEPFFTTKPVGKGTGLGLSISQNIVKKHGGSITVESGLNHGTLFQIFLPIQQTKSSDQV